MSVIKTNMSRLGFSESIPVRLSVLVLPIQRFCVLNILFSKYVLSLRKEFIDHIQNKHETCNLHSPFIKVVIGVFLKKIIRDPNFTYRYFQSKNDPKKLPS